MGSHLLRVRPAFSLRESRALAGTPAQNSASHGLPCCRAAPPLLPRPRTLSRACHVPGTTLSAGVTAERRAGEGPGRGGLRLQPQMRPPEFFRLGGRLREFRLTGHRMLSLLNITEFRTRVWGGYLFTVSGRGVHLAPLIPFWLESEVFPYEKASRPARGKTWKGLSY